MAVCSSRGGDHGSSRNIARTGSRGPRGSGAGGVAEHVSLAPHVRCRRHRRRSTAVVRWKPVKSLWISGMTLAAADRRAALLSPGARWRCSSPRPPSPSASAIRSACIAGSSIAAYDCPLWLERLFVYLGTLVGMAGPYGMIRQHDIRDWAQRKPRCHPYLAHRSSLLRDGFWQLHCELTARASARSS